VSIYQENKRAKNMCFVLCLRRPKHHLLQGYLGCRAQLSFVFFHKGPQFIALYGGQFYIVYEKIICSFGVLRKIFYKATNRISVVACYTLYRA